MLSGGACCDDKGHTRIGTPTEPSGTREVAQKVAKPSTSKPEITATTKKACADIEKAFQDFLLTESVAAPADCYGDHPATETDSAELRENASSLRFVIAILPDPLHTHFSLLFDRDAEAIQKAAADEQYVFDSSWLPWDTDEQTYTRLRDQDRADDRKDAREKISQASFFSAKLNLAQRRCSLFATAW